MLTEQITSRYPNLSEQQAAVVGHVHGPLLVIAGPGSGKTTTLLLRALNLIAGGYARPNEVAICTFSQRAARELRQRFDRAALDIGLDEDVSGVRIQTIHGLCRDILRDGDRTAGRVLDRLTLDSFEQLVFIQSRLDDIAAPEQVRRLARCWGDVGVPKELSDRFNTIAERLIDPAALTSSGNALHRALGECYLRYTDELRRRGMMDFAHLQRWALGHLEQDHGSVPMARELKWVMVDEYQDTNRVQERLLMALCSNTGNVGVVGDDDQAIYGFRGATVWNILDFPEWYPDCETMLLGANYRS